MHRIILDGARFHDIATFYDELNRQVMAVENWQLGPSLDALNDLLYGGTGNIPGSGSVTLVWRHIEKSREDLGLAETRRWLLQKLDGGFDRARIAQQLADLKAGRGKTYFDIILDILADHPRITLERG
jgi:RNAse (barnase) inhibitor barstar